MKIDSEEIIGGTIVIDSVEDEISNSKLKHVKLVARVPLLLSKNNILWTKYALYEAINHAEPYARIFCCILDDVELPKAEYNDNYFRELMSAQNVTIP